MPEAGLLLGLVGIVLLLAARREHAADNRRDARLLAGSGLGDALAGALAWFG